MKYKNKDLSVVEKAKIIGMQMEKSREELIIPDEMIERLLKKQGKLDLWKPEDLKKVEDTLNSIKITFSEKHSQKDLQQLVELMKGYTKAPESYKALRWNVFLEAKRLNWLEDKYDIDEIEKVVWALVKVLYNNRSITQKQFSKIKKITVSNNKAILSDEIE
jgi:hypothetical protein